MSNDHHNNGHNEKKPVAFTAPLILGSITIFIILLFVSLGNPCHGCCEGKEECSKECKEACEKGGKSEHSEVSGKEEGKEVGEENEATESKEAEKTDSTKMDHAHDCVARRKWSSESFQAVRWPTQPRSRLGEGM